MFVQNKRSDKLLMHIRSTYTSLIIQFKPIQFVKIIDHLLNEPTCVPYFATRLSEVYCDIGHTFADLGYFKYAIEFFEKAIKSTKDTKFIASIINNIGTVYSDLRKLDKALEKFYESKKIDCDNPTTWTNIAKMHQFNGNYVKAEEVFSEAATHFKNQDEKISQYMELRSKLMALKTQEMINMNLVSNPKALKHLLTARQLVINLNNLESLKENTGVIFINLTNAFEILFHTLVSPYLLEVLRKKYPAKAYIPPEVWKILPHGIRKLWKGKKMSLENIYFLIEKLLDNNQYNIVKEFRDNIPPQISNEDLKVLQNFVDLGKKPRNPGAHGEVIDYKKYIEYIPEIIEKLNRSIIVFSKIQKD